MNLMRLLGQFWTRLAGMAQALNPKPPESEEEWAASKNPQALLAGIPTEVRRRKVRLLLAIRGRRLCTEATDPAVRDAFVLAERIADDKADEAERQAAIEALANSPLAEPDDWFIRALASWGLGENPDQHLSILLLSVGSPTPANPGTPVLGHKAVDELCDLVREVAGNPFRRSPIDPRWLAWNDGTVARMARQIYAAQDFGRLPILADALEEAGCTDAYLLTHLRQTQPHVRGCWALDRVLGRG